ncbi:MAG TPA: ATP-binding protein [Myxococcales bacterium LLY-WYZ-16_1]|nr:ATP-binding protein [Myxococcales bacterium LLY-WYZ-16_1]
MRRTLLLLEAPLSERGRALADSDWAVEPRPSVEAALHHLKRQAVHGVVVTPGSVAVPNHIAPLVQRGVPVIWWGDPAQPDVAESALTAGARHFVPRVPGSERLVRLLVERSVEQDWAEDEPATDPGHGAAQPAVRPDGATHEAEEGGSVEIRDSALLEGLAASSAAIYVLGDHGFRWVNPAFSRLFGRARSELCDPKFDVWSLVAPESRRILRQRRRAMAQRGTGASRYEFRAVHSCGRQFDVEVAVSDLRVQGISCVLGILQDVTLRRQHEGELVRKNRELSILLELAESAVESRDPADLAHWVCQRLVATLEVDCAALVTTAEDGHVLAEAVPPEFATDGGLFDDRGCAFELGLGEDDLSLSTLQAGDWGASEGFVRRLVLPLRGPASDDGRLILLSRNPQGLPTRDISVAAGVARQLALAFRQLHLHAAAEASAERSKILSDLARAIGSSLDVEGVFRVVGERLVDLVPFERAVLAMLRADQRSFSVRVVDRPSSDGRARVEAETPIVVRPSEPFSVVLESRAPACLLPGHGQHPDLLNPKLRFTVVPVCADGDGVGVLAVGALPRDRHRRSDLALLEDLAAHMGVALKNARIFQELDAAYGRLRDMQDKLGLYEKLRVLGEMAAGVAHDFNNILASISGRAQMLKASLPEEPKLVESVRVIEKAAADGARTVGRIREFAQDRSDTSMTPIRINALVRDAVEMCATRLHERADVDLQLDLGEVEATFGRPSELREVLVNLIHNALDSMPRGGRLRVETGTEVDCSGVFIDVEDEGMGMEPAVAKRIFDPFFTTKGKGGTGLGLSVSSEIVQHHGGRIDVRSVPHRGTRFRVELPVRERADGETVDLEFAEATPLPELVDAGQPRLRVLVVEDDGAIRSVLNELLQSEGFVVTGVGRGGEAVETLAQAQFDLVLTDLEIPDCDGWAVVSTTRRTQTDAAIAVMTGREGSMEQGDERKESVDAFLLKPFRFDSLRQLLQRVQQRRRSSKPGVRS